MISAYTKAVFQEHLNEIFEIELANSEKLVLHLLEIKALGTQHLDKSENEAFALYFLDKEHPSSFLPQATYTLNHVQLGQLELFIVPMGPQKEGMLYEVIFT